MSKIKTKHICDCILIVVFFLCIMTTNSFQENRGVNMSSNKHKSDEIELNSTEEINILLVTKNSDNINLNRSEHELNVEIEHNDQIETNSFSRNLFISTNAHNNYNPSGNDSFKSGKTYQFNKIDYDIDVNDLKENFSQQNTSQKSDVLIDEKLIDKEILILPIIPSVINSYNMNESSGNSLYTSGSQTFLESTKTTIFATKTLSKSEINQTFNDIESEIIEQTNSKDSNMKVIIAETTEVVTTRGKCSVQKTKCNIKNDRVIFKCKLSPQTHLSHICLYLNDNNKCNNVSELCKGSENGCNKCSNISVSECECEFKKTKNDSNYIIGWYGCDDNNKNCTNCTSCLINSDNTGSDTKVIVITLAITVPLLIFVAIFSAFFYNKQKKTNCLGVKKLKQIPLSRSSSRKRLERMPTDANAVINMEEMETKVNPKSKPILLTDFNQSYLSKKADSNLKLAEEYEELKTICSKKKSAKLSQISVNKPKNRFVNILAYDHSIVKLQIRNNELGSDYINANFIAGHNSDKEYIACQGPLKSTVNDFFRMIIEHNVQMIVMLTQCMEKGRPKCEKYWPSSDDVEETSDSNTPTLVFGDITIELISERTENDFIIRDLKLIKDNSSHLLTQYHFSQWPDFGCPQNPLSLIHLIEVLRKHFQTISQEKTKTEEHEEQQSLNSPILVHCSAGVGRSGTFIAVDQIWQKLSQIWLNSHRSWSQDISIDIFGTVCDMRKNRPNMVQTEDQYIYIYECVKHLIEKIESENSSIDSEESRIENEDVIDIMTDDICQEEDKESVLNNNYKSILEDQNNSNAFDNHQFSLEEAAE